MVYELVAAVLAETASRGTVSLAPNDWEKTEKKRERKKRGKKAGKRKKNRADLRIERSQQALGT